MGDPGNNGNARKILFSSIGMAARNFQATFNLRNLASKFKAKTTLKFPMWNIKFLT
jgi:hypothetical protein